MKVLTHEEMWHVRAAQGWLELGATGQAREELTHVRPKSRRHPDVLEVMWLILAREKHWERCVEVADDLRKQSPQRASGWLHLAYAMHELGQTSDAYDVLVMAVNGFPEEFIMRYNLACYCCQLGHLEEARDWLRQALRSAKNQPLRAMAMQDLDLKPLWQEIPKL